MADEKKKAKRLITPKFTAMFAWLGSPNTKHDVDGVYQVSGKFDPKVPEHRAFLKALTDIHKENVAECQKAFKPKKKTEKMKVQPPIHEEDDGTFRVNFKEAAFIVPKAGANAGKKIDLKPPTVDAGGQPTDVEVWSGSVVRVAVDVAPFYNGSLGAGLSLRLKGVQVIELRTRGSRDGASLGFDSVAGFGNDGGGEGAGTPDFSGTPADDLLSDDVGGDDEPAAVSAEEASGATSDKPASDGYDF